MSEQTGKVRAGLVIFLIVVLLAIGALFRSGLVKLPGRPVYGAPRVSLRIESNFNPVSLGSLQNGFASVVDPALPAVVNISSTKIVRQQAPNILNDPFFRQFFGNQFGPSQPQSQPQTEREYSLGSGVIVNPDGYILTNNHVVAGASDVEVFTQNQKKFKAKVLGTDAQTDIAVLKIDTSGLSPITIGDSSRLKVGDLVFAIGDPFGVGETATTGIVSATGRHLGGSIEHYENFIQTDAAINPGNSGGALIDLHGDLIGINTAIISGGGGGNEGIGFAIPINMARNVMDQIIARGKVVRGYMGVTIQPVTPDMARAFGLSQGGGALIAEIVPGGPAAKAGLERGDIILDFNGQPVTDSGGFSIDVSQMAPGAVILLTIFRNGQMRDVSVTLGGFPQSGSASQPSGGAAPAAALVGLQVDTLTPAIAQQLGLAASTPGVVVTNVDSSSAAAAAGIQRGDVIQEVNRKPVGNLDQYQQDIAGLGNQSVLLLINRAGQTTYVVLQPQ